MKRTEGMSNKDSRTSDAVSMGAFDRVIGGGTALIRGKKPTFTVSGIKNVADGEIVTDPQGSWTGVPSDDPYSVPVQDADDL